MTINKKLITLVAIGALQAGCVQSEHNRSESPSDTVKTYRWLTIAPTGEQVARSVTTNTQCPFIQIDGKAFAMTPRSSSGAPQHFEQVLSCETRLPDTAESVDIEGVKLTPLKKQVERIVVIGDTGCRVKTGDYQNCNNIAGGAMAWPFAQTARLVAEAKPDLIVHLGDYLYREKPCPALNEGCRGPTGFNWASWQADFFEPAAAMLPTAPWVMTRGNHEDCNRAWKGWFYLLDVYDLKAQALQKCREYSMPYAVDLGGLDLINMDSATLPDAYSLPVNPQTQRKYTALYEQVNQLSSANNNNSWLMTHRPLWAVSSYFDWKNNKDAIATTDPTMQAALAQTQRGGFVDTVKLLLAGHIHNFETLKFRDQRPSVLVVGNSGTKTSPTITPAQTKAADIFTKLNMQAQDFYATNQFGYVLMERKPHDAWLIHLMSLEGKTLQRFILTGKDIQRVWEN